MLQTDQVKAGTRKQARDVWKRWIFHHQLEVADGIGTCCFRSARSWVLCPSTWTFFALLVLKRDSSCSHRSFSKNVNSLQKQNYHKSHRRSMTILSIASDAVCTVKSQWKQGHLILVQNLCGKFLMLQGIIYAHESYFLLIGT